MNHFFFMQITIYFAEAAQYCLMQLQINDDAFIRRAAGSMQQRVINKSHCIEGALLDYSEQHGELIACVVAGRGYYCAVCKIERFGERTQMPVCKICTVPEKSGFFRQRFETEQGPELIEVLARMQARLQASRFAKHGRFACDIGKPRAARQHLLRGAHTDVVVLQFDQMWCHDSLRSCTCMWLIR